METKKKKRATVNVSLSDKEFLAFKKKLLDKNLTISSFFREAITHFTKE